MPHHKMMSFYARLFFYSMHLCLLQSIAVHSLRKYANKKGTTDAVPLYIKIIYDYPSATLLNSVTFKSASTLFK